MVNKHIKVPVEDIFINVFKPLLAVLMIYLSTLLFVVLRSPLKSPFHFFGSTTIWSLAEQASGHSKMWQVQKLLTNDIHKSKCAVFKHAMNALNRSIFGLCKYREWSFGFLI